MSSDFNLPHIDISDRAISREYKAHRPNIGEGKSPRVRGEHGAKLLAQLRSAFREVKEQEAPDDRVARADGAYYEIELRKGGKAEKLDRKTDGVVTGAAKLDPKTGSMSVVVFVPDAAVSALEKILEDYAEGPLTPKREQPPKKPYVEPIEAIRRARLQDFWTDREDNLPRDPQMQIWWEIWCVAGNETGVIDVLNVLGCRAADEDLWLRFPEVVVVPVLARRADIEVALFACEGITELRRGSDTPTFFMEDERGNQHAWANELAERTVWPGVDVPRVCLLDTGVNRSHVLIEPALAEGDLLAVDPDWVTRPL